jgi:hypothetical protein
MNMLIRGRGIREVCVTRQERESGVCEVEVDRRMCFGRLCR